MRSQGNRLTSAPYTTTIVAATGPDSTMSAKQDAQAVTNLGGGLIATPAVVTVPAAGGAPAVPLYIGVGADRRLYVRTASAGWTLLVPGSGCYSNPGAVVTPSGGGYTLTVACQGGDNALYYWQTPVSAIALPLVTTAAVGQGGTLIAGPAVALVSGSLTFFVEGTDHYIYSKTATGAFTQVPAQCIGHPAAATQAAVSYLACQGLDGKLYFLTNSGSGWSAAQGGVGQLIDGPGIAATSSQLAIFVEGTDAKIYHTNVPLGGGTPSAFVVDGFSAQYGAAASGASGSSYTYNGDGLRAAKVLGDGSMAGFTWDPPGGLPQLLSDGTTSYIYGPDGLPLEQIDAGGVVTWYHHDQLGSTRTLTSSTGAVVGTATYDPYGHLSASTGMLTSFGFAGQYADAETGFVYLRARYYDPSTTQFISRDPLVMVTRSAYGYVGGNPLNSIDPSGMLDLNPIDLAKAVGSALGDAAGHAGSAVWVFGTTHMFGWCLTGSMGLVFGGTATGCVVGNLHSAGVTGTLGGGLDLPGGADVSTGPFFSDAHSQSDLKGIFSYAGASIGDGLVANAEFGGGTLACGRSVHYATGGLGLGYQFPLPLSIWTGVSNTWTAGW